MKPNTPFMTDAFGSARKLVLATLAVTALLLCAASQAFADRTVSVSFDGHLRGKATFIADGDWLRVCDNRRDGLPVSVEFAYIKKNGKRQTGSHQHKAGVDNLGNAGPEGRRRGCSYGNHNFGEGRTIWLRACVQHQKSQTCSQTVATGTGRK